MKIAILDGYSTEFTTQATHVGTFVPRGQAFMHSSGNN